MTIKEKSKLQYNSLVKTKQQNNKLKKNILMGVSC